MTYKTQGIILRKQDWKDYDRLFTFYTRDYGKVKAVAKGVKKIQSKLAGHLQEFALIDLFIANGRNIDQIGGALINQNFFNIRSDLNSINSALSGLELVDQLVKEKLPDEGIFNLVNEYLEIVDAKFSSGDKLKLNSLKYIFCFKFLSQLGYRPQLYNCLSCKNKIISDSNFFDHRGGVVCSICSTKHKEIFPISKEAIKVLRFCLDNSLGEYLKVNTTRNLELELVKVIEKFLEMRLDRELKV